MTGDDTIDRNGDASPSQVRDLAGEAMRRRIAARLFGEEFDAVFLGRFRIVEALGHGGMGVVYAAEDDKLDRRVAIKVIREDRMLDGPRDRIRLLREARSLAKLSHPNVVQVYEVNEHEGGVFIVMELVRGTTLRAWLSAERRPLAEVLARFVEAGQGLAAAHRVGIVHRDFKPANALVGEDGRVRIADFGLARGDAHAAETAPEGAVAAAQRASTTGVGLSLPSTATPAGTPGYMAPEQLLGAPSDARSDQYSFCVALFEAVYGRPPIDQSHMFPGASAGALVPADRQVPGWLRRLLARGLAARPEDRHASMATLITALQETPRRRRRIQLAVAGAMVMVMALTLAVAIGGALSKQTRAPMCAAVDPRIAEIWNEPRRAAIERAFVDTRLPHAESTWRRVADATEAYVARWTAAHVASCEARVQGPAAIEQYSDSLACLDDARLALAGLLDVLGMTDAETLAEADRLVAVLPAPERCREPQPSHLHGRRGDRPLRALLDRAEIAFQTAQGGDAMALLGPLISHLHASLHTALEAEALLLQGKVEGRLLGQPARARRSLDAALDRAGLARRTDLLWQILNEQASVSATEFDGDAARQWWERASNSVDRADDRSKVALASVEGDVLVAEKRFDAAVQRGSEVVALLGEPGPDEHPELLEKRALLAATLGDADRFPEALALNKTLFTELTRRYGGEHPATARVELNLGFDHLEIGEYALARAHVEHARGVLLASFGRHHPRTAAADMGLAKLEMLEEHYDAAIERARAAEAIYREVLGVNAADRVSALVLLADLYVATERTSDLLAVNDALLEVHRSGVRHTEIDVPVLLANIGDGLCALGRCQEALPYFGELLAMQRGPKAEPLMLALAQRGMGLVHLAEGEPAAALRYLERALVLLQALPPWADVSINLVATARETADVLTRLRRDRTRIRDLRALADRVEAELAAPPPEAL